MPLAADLGLRDLRVVVLHPRDGEGERLLRALQRLGCNARIRWPPTGAEAEEADVLFYRVEPGTGALAARYAERPGTALVGVLQTAGEEALRLLQDSFPHAVLGTPVEAAMVLPALLVARHNARFQRRLLTKIGKLEETLRSFRKVERAKTILMAQRGISEPEAYAYLREQAMRKRVPIGTVASLVIETHEVLSSGEGSE